MSEKNKNKSQNLVPISEAASFLGVSIATLRRWDTSGKIKAVRKSGRYRYFSMEELERIKLSKPFSITEAAQFLGISVSTLRRLEAKKVIVPERDTNGERLYSKEILKQFLESEYFLSQKRVQEEVLEKFNKKPEELPPSSHIAEDQKVLDGMVSVHENQISRLNLFVKALKLIGLIVSATFGILISFLTILLILSPVSTAKWLELYHEPPMNLNAVTPAENEGAFSVNPSLLKAGILDFNQPESPRTHISGRFLRPFGEIALGLVQVIDKNTYRQIVPENVFRDVNEVFTRMGNEAIISPYKFYLSDNAHLEVMEAVDENGNRKVARNLNADFLQGRKPGNDPGDLVYFDEEGNLVIPKDLKVHGNIYGKIAGAAEEGEIQAEKKGKEEAPERQGKSETGEENAAKKEGEQEKEGEGMKETEEKPEEENATETEEGEKVTIRFYGGGSGGGGGWSTPMVASSLPTSIIGPLAGDILMYDGLENWFNVAVSGDASLAANGALSISDNVIDFTELADALTLDNATEISLGDHEFGINLDSAGDFVIKNDGTAFVYFTDDGKVGIGNPSPNSILDVNSGSDSTSSILTLGNASGDFQIFRTDATPEGAVTGSTGDLVVDTSNGVVYIKSSGDASSSGWTEVVTKDSNQITGNYIGPSASSYNGSFASGLSNSYEAANAICNATYSGSHLCSTEEIMSTIRGGNFSAYTGNHWIANGPPGYTASANDCEGWGTSSENSLGPFWNWDANDGGGKGLLTPCSSSLTIACCSS